MEITIIITKNYIFHSSKPSIVLFPVKHLVKRKTIIYLHNIRHLKLVRTDSAKNLKECLRT